MSTETKQGGDSGAAESVPSNTRTLGVESGTFQLPGTGSADLDLPGKEAAPEGGEAEDTVVDGNEATATDDTTTTTTTDDTNEGDNTDESGDEADENSEGEATEYGNTLDIAAYQKEFDTNGELSDATYDHITKITGMERADIDSVVGAMQDRQAKNTERWDNMLGGKENKAAVLNWARDNYSDAQRASFNKVLDSGDVHAIDIALKGMVADYREAGGTFKAQGGAVVSGEVPNFGDTAQAGGFTTEGEYREAIRSPRYKKDPSYRAEIQKKLRASPFYKKSRGK